MTMQIGRAIVAILIGPALARFLVRWAAGDEPASSGVNASK
jgi:hypothetical protein